MRRSDALRLIEALGYEPETVKTVILRGDEVEVREISIFGDGSAVWFINERDFPAAEETFLALAYQLNRDAPVPLGEITAIRMDWRGVTVTVSNGLQWQIPYEAEPEYANE